MNDEPLHEGQSHSVDENAARGESDHHHEHASYPPMGETSELAEAGVLGAVCPRCDSWQVVAGNLLDGLGQPIRFGLMYRRRAPGVSDNEAPPVLALYCNACGEVTLTLG